jgi:hypothetical protein
VAATYLAHPSVGAEICMMVDASADHVGAALQQKTYASAACNHTIFFSKKLELAQMKHSSFNQELLASILVHRTINY